MVCWKKLCQERNILSFVKDVVGKSLIIPEDFVGVVIYIGLGIIRLRIVPFARKTDLMLDQRYVLCVLKK